MSVTPHVKGVVPVWWGAVGVQRWPSQAPGGFDEPKAQWLFASGKAPLLGPE